MRLTLITLICTFALAGLALAAPNAFAAALVAAMAIGVLNAIAAHPLQAAAWAVFVVGLTFWCHDMLERRGWRATLWACASVSGFALILATMRGIAP